MRSPVRVGVGFYRLGGVATPVAWFEKCVKLESVIPDPLVGNLPYFYRLTLGLTDYATLSGAGTLFQLCIRSEVAHGINVMRFWRCHQTEVEVRPVSYLSESGLVVTEPVAVVSIEVQPDPTVKDKTANVGFVRHKHINTPSIPATTTNLPEDQ